MLLKKTGTFLLFCLVAFAGNAQKKEIISAYIRQYQELAIAEMKRTGVPAAITLAQGIHESGAGNSDLARASNNHFGIKCKSNWTGESVRHDDDAKGECFRKYPSAEDSYKDHSDFLRNGQRYASLFTLDPEDYKGWAHGLKKAGYATNPKYPEVLIKLIEDYELQTYSVIALGKKEADNEGQAPVIISATNNNGNTQPGATAVPVAENIAVEKVSYPEDVFQINETKVIFAKKGTSWFSIARQYAIDLSKLYEFNDADPAEALGKDQLVYIQRKRKTGNNEFHTVLPGETLLDIAQSEAIRLESLKELNWLRGNDRPAPGEKLSLKTKSTVMPKLMLKDNFPLVPVAPGKATH